MREIGGADRGLDAHRIAVVEHHGLVAMVVRVDVAHIEIQREQRRGGQHGRAPLSVRHRTSPHHSRRCARERGGLSFAFASGPVPFARGGHRHMDRDSERKEPVGHRPAAVLSGGRGRMLLDGVGVLLPTPGGRLQLRAFCLPSAPPLMPSVPASQGHKEADELLYGGQRSGFNIIYAVIGRHTARNPFSCVTFGAVFADSFSKQHYN